MNDQVKGTFTCTMDLSRYTTEQAFSSRGLSTPVTVFTTGFYLPFGVMNDIIADEDLDLCFHSPRGKLHISARHNLIDRGDEETRQGGMLPEAGDCEDLVTNSNGERFFIGWFLLGSRMGQQQSYHRRYWRLMAQITPVRSLDDATAQVMTMCDEVGSAEVLLLEVGHITLDHAMDHVSADFDAEGYSRNDHRLDAELTVLQKMTTGEAPVAPKRRRSAVLAASGITTVHTHCL